MFIPIWFLHIIATLAFILLAIVFNKDESSGWYSFDIMPIIRLLGYGILYALYWVIFLAVNKGCAV